MTAVLILGLAAAAWVYTIRQTSTMGEMGMGGAMGMDMDAGLGSPASFAAVWTVTMAAMMLPSALPLVYEFARRSEGRRRWQVSTAVLSATYLSVWLAFGLLCYVALSAFPVPPADQGLVGGLALALAGLYGLTPIRAASEARCRELCSLHGPLPFSLVRSAVVAGAKYGLSCLGCSAGLMVAMAIIGMSSVAWMVILAGVVLVYKLAPTPSLGRTRMVSLALIASAIAYATTV
jgi:predicted metal-binding membrane protein